MGLKKRQRWVEAIVLVLCCTGIAACGEAQTPGTQSTLVTPRSNITRASTGQPNIRISPTHGKAGTYVTVVGSGFPAGSEVQIKLSGQNTAATIQSYGSDTAAQHGNIQIGFVMPDHWPNGESIVIPQVVVVATTPDFLDKATAQFSNDTYSAPQGTPTVGGTHALTKPAAGALLTRQECDAPEPPENAADAPVEPAN